MKKRLFAFFLCFMMLFSLLPTSVLAASHSSTVDINTLAAGDTIAVGTEITGLTNGLSILYFSCDEGFFVDKSYSGASCTVEGAVVNSSNTANIGAPENGFWKVTSVNAAASTLSLISTDQVYPPLYFYTYDPFVLEITISTNPTNKWPTGMTKTGYTWYGWSLLDGTAVTESYAQTSQGYEAIFGRWRNDTTGELFPAIYTVTFDYNDGATAAITRNTSLRGGVLGWPAAPTREGYTFMGWEDASGNTHGSADLFSANTTLTAKWQEGTVAPTYNVTFNYNDGETANLVLTTDENGKITNWPADPTREGYTFIAWADSNGNHKTDSAVFTEATTLTAHWRELPKTYTVTFDYNDNASQPITRSTDTDGIIADWPSNPTRDGFIFSGWKNENEQIVTASTAFSDNTTLTAQWIEDNGTSESITVTFYADEEGTDVAGSVTLPIGGSLSTDDYPEIGVGVGVTFEGWFLKDGTKVDGTYVFTESTAVYARVSYETTSNSYTIKFMDGTNEIATCVTDENDTILADRWPETGKEGHYFSHWALEDGTKVSPGYIFTESVAVYAHFKEIIVVTFYVDTDNIGSADTDFEGKLDSEAWPNVNKAGYTLTHWALEDGTSVDSETVFTTHTNVYAQFEVDPNYTPDTDTVQVLFFVDGQQVSEHNIEKGSTINPLPSEHKDNYEFLGWATDVNDHGTIIGDDHCFATDTQLHAVFVESSDDGGGSSEHVTILFFVDGEQIAEHGILKGSPVEEYPDVNKGGFIFLGWATDPNDHNTIVDSSQTFSVDTDLYAVFEEDPNAGEAENPVVEMTAAVENGKIVGLPGLGDGLKFMYLALAEGDLLFDAPVTAEEMEFLVEDMNSTIGMDIMQVTLDRDSHDNAFINLTDSTVINKDGEFLLVVVATDINADENGDRRIFAIYADIIKNTIVAGEIENATESSENTGSAKLDNTVEELEAAVPFTEEELEAIENGEDVQIWLEVTDITNSVSGTDKTLVENKKSTYTVGMYIDASMFKQVGDSSEEKLSELNEKVTITITLSDSLINTNANLFRTYRVIRVHDGIAEIITPTFDEKTNTLTFETDCFSTYAIAYKDSTVPKTGDNHDLFFWSATLAVSAIGFIVANKKRKYN